MTDAPYGTGTCARHRRLFVTILSNFDLRDWVAMDRVRLMFIAEAGRNFRNSQIRRWMTTNCIGCDQEQWTINTLDKLAEYEAAAIDLEHRAAIRSREP